MVVVVAKRDLSKEDPDLKALEKYEMSLLSKMVRVEVCNMHDTRSKDTRSNI